MAKTGIPFTRGTIGNLVYYPLHNRQVVRTKAVHVRQTKATKERSRNFGLASAAGRALRAQLHQVLLLPKDGRMQARFTGAIARWLQRQNVTSIPATRNLPFISSFSFSPETGMYAQCRIPIVVEQPAAGLITVRLGAFIPHRDVDVPPRTGVVRLRVCVATCSLQQGTATGGSTVEMHFDYDKNEVPARQLDFPVPVQPGLLLLTAASLQYVSTEGTLCRQPPFMPCSVIDACYSGNV